MPTYTLTPRQERLYGHLCDLWERTLSVDPATGAPGAETLARVAENVPCYYQYNPNVDDPTDAARFNKATLFTTDKVHLPDGVTVSNGWWIVNRTPGPNLGEVHKVLGAPQINPGDSARATNKQAVTCMREEKPPEDLVYE